MYLIRGSDKKTVKTELQIWRYHITKTTIYLHDRKCHALHGKKPIQIVDDTNNAMFRFFAIITYICYHRQK